MRFEKLSKSYDGVCVLAEVSGDFPSDGTVCLCGHSGIGKTTLLRLLMGLEQPDSGTVHDRPERFSAVFQEETLCERLDAVRNVEIVCPNLQRKKIVEAYEKVGLVGEDLTKPVAELSGGMRRRVSVVRATEAEGTYIFMDEPFKGLDEDTRGRVIQYVVSSRRGRGLCVVTHDISDINDLTAIRYDIKEESR